MDEKDSIDSIFVRPRNKFYCEYILNNGESVHTKTYDQIRKYLLEIIPERLTQVNYALMRFQSFIIIVPEKEFIFLQLNDIAEHYDEIKEKVLNPSIQEAEQVLRLEKKMTSDDKIKQISEIEGPDFRHLIKS